MLLGVAAAATERVRLGTHILIARVYPPVHMTLPDVDASLEMVGEIMTLVGRG